MDTKHDRCIHEQRGSMRVGQRAIEQRLRRVPAGNNGCDGCIDVASGGCVEKLGLQG